MADTGRPPSPAAGGDYLLPNHDYLQPLAICGLLGDPVKDRTVENTQYVVLAHLAVSRPQQNVQGDPCLSLGIAVSWLRIVDKIITFQSTSKLSEEVIRAALACPYIIHGPPCQVVVAFSILFEDGVETSHVEFRVHIVCGCRAPMPAAMNVINVNGKERVREPVPLRAVRGT
jgi:hypothetical protein